tara:strand:- start:1000 stop:1917 length:918 start_codon:yes stop_codon:yes gene_type:complete
MRYYKNFKIKKIDKRSLILIGNFDGIHIGHQKLFNLANKYKKKYKLKIGVLTFEPVPKMFFNKNLKNFRISNSKQKNFILKKLGVDFVITKKFDKNFSKKKSYQFIKNILYKKINPKYIFVSSNFKFGNKREGNVKKLIQYEKFFDYKIINPKPLIKKNKIISSTFIRKLLIKGKLSKANKLLSRNWTIEGFIEKGRQQGKKIGFPTCNIDIKDYVIAKPGVYAVTAKFENDIGFVKGIANLGYRPTFKQKKILLEVHLFNFSRNVYNKYISVEFLKFIRKEKKFDGIDKLKKQIQFDLKVAKKS